MGNIEVDQRYYMAKVNLVDRRHFYKHLANIVSCTPAGFDFTPTDESFCSLYLHPTNGFSGIDRS